MRSRAPHLRPHVSWPRFSVSETVSQSLFHHSFFRTHPNFSHQSLTKDSLRPNKTSKIRYSLKMKTNTNQPQPHKHSHPLTPQTPNYSQLISHPRFTPHPDFHLRSGKIRIPQRSAFIFCECNQIVTPSSCACALPTTPFRRSCTSLGRSPGNVIVDRLERAR